MAGRAGARPFLLRGSGPVLARLISVRHRAAADRFRGLDGAKAPRLDPWDEPFWLTWAEAYQAVLAAAGPNVYVFDCDRACAEAEPMMAALLGALDLQDPSDLLAQATRLRRPTRNEAGDLPDTVLGARVREVYEAIQARSDQAPPSEAIQPGDRTYTHGTGDARGRVLARRAG
ncbi:MAG: hypothetical protein ACREIR_16540 [Geminicoccaceae bacterium]